MSLRVLITGAGGYIGSEVLRRLADIRDQFEAIVAMDVRETPTDRQLDGIEYVQGDIRDEDLVKLFEEHRFTSVVHLASIVTPGKKSNREFEYSVDVLGTKNIVECCVATGVKQLIVTSSGAAYGYFADNPMPLRETDAIRGNPEFAYSDHKRLVEEMLAEYRKTHPELGQLILRPGTVLGATTNNQITRLFEGGFILGVRGSDTPFVFIWDQDVADIIVKGIIETKTGIHNLAGDGALTMREIAGILGKPYISVPVSILQSAIWILKQAGMTQYGPEQVNFIRYRPVLANDRLKEEFGYTPKKTTREAFDYFLEQRAKRP